MPRTASITARYITARYSRGMADLKEELSETMYCILLSLREERHGYGVIQHVAEFTAGTSPGRGHRVHEPQEARAGRMDRTHAHRGSPPLLPPHRSRQAGPRGPDAPHRHDFTPTERESHEHQVARGSRRSCTPPRNASRPGSRRRPRRDGSPRDLGDLSAIRLHLSQGQVRARCATWWTHSKNPDDDYRATYEDAGWEYVGELTSLHVWRRQYRGERPEAFTDRAESPGPRRRLAWVTGTVARPRAHRHGDPRRSGVAGIGASSEDWVSRRACWRSSACRCAASRGCCCAAAEAPVRDQP